MVMLGILDKAQLLRALVFSEDSSQLPAIPCWLPTVSCPVSEDLKHVSLGTKHAFQRHTHTSMHAHAKHAIYIKQN